MLTPKAPLIILEPISTKHRLHTGGTGNYGRNVKQSGAEGGAGEINLLRFWCYSSAKDSAVILEFFPKIWYSHFHIVTVRRALFFLHWRFDALN